MYPLILTHETPLWKAVCVVRTARSIAKATRSALAFTGITHILKVINLQTSVDKLCKCSPKSKVVKLIAATWRKRQYQIAKNWTLFPPAVSGLMFWVLSITTQFRKSPKRQTHNSTEWKISCRGGVSCWAKISGASSAVEFSNPRVFHLPKSFRRTLRPKWIFTSSHLSFGSGIFSGNWDNAEKSLDTANGYLCLKDR